NIAIDMKDGDTHNFPALRYLVFLGIFLYGISFQSQAQNYYFRHYQTEDGLSHNTVFDIIQDRNGFIWLGTKGGLNCFDGYNFKNVFSPGTKKGTDYVTALCEGENNIIWVGTSSSFYRYNTADLSVKEVGIPSAYIKDIQIDNKGR